MGISEYPHIDNTIYLYECQWVPTNNIVFMEVQFMERHKNKAYNLRLNEEIMNEIRELAEKNYRPISKQIELMLLEWLDNERKKKSE